MENKTFKKTADDFFVVADKFCRDVVTFTLDYLMVGRFIDDLSDLFIAADHLPKNVNCMNEPMLDVEGGPTNVPTVRIFNKYLEVDNPYRKESTKERSVQEELNGIFQSLCEGSVYYEQGYYRSALYSWKEGFSYYWGKRIPGLLKALYYAKEGLDEDLNQKNGTIYSLKAIGQISSGYEINVFSREKDNVMIERGINRVFNQDVDDTNMYTVSKEDINSLIEIIQKADLLFDENIPFEEPEISVLDGFMEIFYVNNFTDRLHYEMGNFTLKFDGYPFETKAGQLIAINDKVNEILKKNGIMIEDQEDEEIPD